MKKNYKRKTGLIALAMFSLVKLGAQQSYTFTPCGATGSLGPTQLMVTNSYSNTNLAGAVGTVTNGIQTWTVPYTGNFRIEARGAQGGGGGGLGAVMAGDFALIGGEVLQILVGQMGDNGSSGPSGGSGGSFVVRTPYNATTAILVIAGGGSGAGNYSFTPGQSTTSGATGGVAGGTNGNGGLGGTRGAGGGGFLTDGSPCSVNTNYASPGRAFVNGGAGGAQTNNCSFTASGGFGGGSSHGGNCINNGGAGGGFSGGGGSSNTTSGGGGSLNNGTNQLNAAGTNTGNGRVIITELCSVQLFASGSNSTNPIMCSGNSLTLTTNAVSNYSWSTGQTTSSIVVTPNTNTVYTMSGTSSQSCSAVGTISVTVSNGFPVLSITNTNTNVCLGTTVSVTATGALSYTWANAGVVNNGTFAPTASAVYTVSGQNGCGISTATTAILVAPLSVSASASPTLVCEGSAATLTAMSAVSGYTWYPASTNGSLTTVAPMSNAIYTVSASDGTCSGTQTVAVFTKTTPTVSIAATSTDICQGDQVVITASGANTYTWLPSNITGPTLTVSPSTSTVYFVTGENTVNCANSAQQIIIVKNSPTITISASKLLVCPGQSVTLTASGGNSYTWTNGPATSGYVVNPMANTIYTVTAGHNANICTTAKTITIAAVNINLTLPTNTQVCIGGTVAAYASGANSYVWNSVSTGSAGMQVFQPSQTTTVLLVATTSSNNVNCPTNHSFVVTVNPLPTITVVPTLSAICRGESNTLTANGAQTYTWNSNTASTSIVVSPTASVIYTVSGTSNLNCENVTFYLAKVNTCTGLDEVNPSGYGFNIYPNPNSGSFTVKSDGNRNLVILNELGQVIYQFSLSAEQEFSADVMGLSKGIYFVKDASGIHPEVQKIIIE